MLNCESLEEIQAVNEIAARLGLTARIALRLNPNVCARTHEKISTGLTENKFGLTSVEYLELAELYPSLANVQIVGLHFHIGSQILHLEVFEHLCQRINTLVPEFEQFFGALEYLNVGGGLGIDYERPEENPIPDFERYFGIFRSNLNVPADFPVHFELGRAIVGQCGTLRAKVLYVKRGETKNFAVLDAGMTELLRPAMYGAKHCIINVTGTAENRERGVYDIVGPICESSDTFATDLHLPQLRRGDLVEIKSCGAYVESMSLNYNGRGAIRIVNSEKVQTRLRVLRTA
jgi:diaminopimelate decarboxylase